MYQGKCVYSGIMLPKGKGITKICNDNKSVLTKSRRERSFMEFKISPRDVKWTESSRAFFKKTNKSIKEKNEIIPITKIVRGYEFVPKALVENIKPVEKKQDSFEKKNMKVSKNANASSFRK